MLGTALQIGCTLQSLCSHHLPSPRGCGGWSRGREDALGPAGVPLSAHSGIGLGVLSEVAVFVSSFPFFLLWVVFRGIFFFLQWVGGRKGERERNIDVRENINAVPSIGTLTGDRTHSPGKCPDQESNR